MTTHSSIRPWKIPRTEEPGRLQFLRSQRVGHERKLWNRRIICIFLTFRLRLTHWNQHFIDMRKNHEKLLMLLTLFLCCNWDSQYSHNSPNSSQPHQPMMHFFLVLFSFSLSIFLPYPFLIWPLTRGCGIMELRGRTRPKGEKGRDGLGQEDLFCLSSHKTHCPGRVLPKHRDQ